jgi:hypothetical protein
MTNGQVENPAGPVFFFSYARLDCDQYLKRFFEDLSKRVAQKGGLDRKAGQVSFLDLTHIEPGDDWDQALSQALQECQVLLSIYTPCYFRREYCGKEFQVFLKRKIRNSTNIVPILWENQKDLDREKLPPSIVHYVQRFEPGQLDETYEGMGVRRVLAKVGARGVYREMIEKLADRVLDLAKEKNLQRLEEPPKLSAIENPFRPQTILNQSQSAGPHGLALIYIVADRPVAQGITNRDAFYKWDSPTEWRPFRTESQEDIGSLIKYLVSGKFDSEDLFMDFASTSLKQDIVDTFRSTTSRNAIPIMVIDPWAMTQSKGRAIVTSLLGNSTWRGGVIIPVDAKDKDTVNLIPTVRNAWELSIDQADRIVVSEVIGSIFEFGHEFLKMLIELQRRIVQKGEVKQIATGKGPSTKPSIHGPGEKRA